MRKEEIENLSEREIEDLICELEEELINRKK